MQDANHLDSVCCGLIENEIRPDRKRANAGLQIFPWPTESWMLAQQPALASDRRNHAPGGFRIIACNVRSNLSEVPASRTREVIPHCPAGLLRSSPSSSA